MKIAKRNLGTITRVFFYLMRIKLILRHKNIQTLDTRYTDLGKSY